MAAYQTNLAVVSTLKHTVFYSLVRKRNARASGDTNNTDNTNNEEEDYVEEWDQWVLQASDVVDWADLPNCLDAFLELAAATDTRLKAAYSCWVERIATVKGPSKDMGARKAAVNGKGSRGQMEESKRAKRQHREDILDEPKTATRKSARLSPPKKGTLARTPSLYKGRRNA